MKSDISKLQQDFDDHVYDKILEKNVTVAQIKICLYTIPVQRKDISKVFFEKICGETSNDLSVEAIWYRLSNYWNFLYYSLLEHIVNQLFAEENLKTSMHGYKKSLKTFQCMTRLCDFANFSTNISKKLSEQDSRDLIVALDARWNTYTLEDLERLTEIIAQHSVLPSFSMTLKSIVCGCIELTWTIPTVLVREITGMSELCRTHNVTSVTKSVDNLPQIELFS